MPSVGAGNGGKPGPGEPFANDGFPFNGTKGAGAFCVPGSIAGPLENGRLVAGVLSVDNLSGWAGAAGKLTPGPVIGGIC